MTKKLSPVMADAMHQIVACGGRVIRREGGYWTAPGAPYLNSGQPYEWWIGTNTIRALVDRQQLEETDWRESHDGKFCVEVRVKP